MPVGIDQAKLFTQLMIAQRVPGPAGQIIGKLVQFEVVLQGTAEHVMFDHAVGHDGRASESS